MRYAVVATPQCFLYGIPGDKAGHNSATIEDEILSGWAVRVEGSEEQGWVKITTHYGYEGYVYEKCLTATSLTALQERQHSPKLRRVISHRELDVLGAPKVQGSLLETLPRNSFVTLAEEEPCDGWTKVLTASGTCGWVSSVFLGERRDTDDFFWTEEEAYFLFAARRSLIDLTEEEEATLRRSITDAARTYLGCQYRWGGKSCRGIDCSGLAFLSYLENGLLIYRDAQIREEYPIRQIPRDELKEGDLLFFPGHVALYLGDEKYIHATGYEGSPMVTINSLNLHDPDYRRDLAEEITAYGSVFASTAAPAPVIKEEATVPDEAFLWLLERLEAFPGSVSLVYKNLLSSSEFTYRPQERMEAASIIKIYLMAAMFHGFDQGEFSPEDKIPVPKEACVPSCGVLTYLDEGKLVSLRDLVELMIIVSDNTAANLLLDFYGEERMQSFLKEELGLTATLFQRKMFDSGRAARGLENYTNAQDTARLLEKIYRGELVSPSASAQMLTILEHQRLNGKIPFYLHALRPKPVIAHKTGENDGVTHDVAIFEGEKPFLLLFFGNKVDVPAYEKFIGEISLAIYQKHEKGEL